MRKLDCLIISTARAASTAVYQYLNVRGNLGLPINKEPHHWCDVKSYPGRYELLDSIICEWPGRIWRPVYQLGTDDRCVSRLFILYRSGFNIGDAVKTALGMSFISMLTMETAMNVTDYLLTGGAILTWWVLPIALFAGFITPWPYNYRRLQKHGRSCH